MTLPNPNPTGPKPITIPLPVQLQPIGNPINAADEALSRIGGAVSATYGWIVNRHNLVRLGWFTVGYAMIIAGLVILTKPAVDSTVGAVSGTVGKVVKGVL